ncbi:chitinase-3-like protein 1 [Macrotis lagotis]|uniref:chitinase-3-like protein 1 n=1 Tax=Macrotis lagotis TaxID=92651 RepID=UPI003D68E897
MARLLLWTGTAFKLVCYFTSWAQYRPQPASIFPEDLDPFLCTHLVYAFASMQHNKIIPRERNDEEEIYPQLRMLKERNNELQILLAIGGWNFGTTRFTTMLSSFKTRETFIYSVIAFLRKHGFDGLDLFFQYPTFRSSPLQDRDRFTFLIQELLFAFRNEAQTTDRSRLLITAAVSGDPNIINKAYDVPTISRFLDYISVLTYDFHGSWEVVTGHNSPLYGMDWERNQKYQLNCAFAMNLWKMKGAPLEKLIMGLPAYGRTFVILNSTGVGVPAFGPAFPGNFTQESGMWAYYEICPFLKDAIQVWMESQKVPYAYKNNSWVGYDDIHSFAYKAFFIKKSNFGGAMVWSLDLDDFRGSFCGLDPFPLVNTLYHILDVRDSNLSFPSSKKFQIPLDVSTLAPEGNISPVPEMLSLLNITSHTLEKSLNPTYEPNIQNSFKPDFITQLLKNSSAPENTTIPTIGSLPPQTTNTLKTTSLAPDNPTPLLADESSSPVGYTVSSHSFTTSTPLPETASQTTSP